MNRIAFLGLLALAGLGCGSDPAGGSGGAGGAANQGGGGDGGASAETCDPAAAGDVTDVSGRWAYRATGSQVTRAPGLEPFHTRIVSVLLFDQQQTGDAISATGTYCDHYTEDPDAIVHAVIPDTYREALKDVARTGTFAEESGARRYRLERLYEVVGATLADPASDPLPVEPTEATVVDQDDDGHPGMTLRLSGLVDGEVYVAERKWTDADGAAVSKDRIEGRLGFSSEQSVLASTPESLKASTASSKTTPDPEPCNSTFVMVRVADDADCDAIKAQEETLFD